MHTEQTTHLPRAERFAVRNPDDLYASIERTDGAERIVIVAEPLDISDGGIKLRVGEPVSFEEQVTLVLGCAEGPMRLTLSCRVAWLRAEWDETWLVGCQFIPKLPAGVLQSLFSSGSVERRQFARCAVNGTAVAKWELQPESFDVEFIDISQGGFCLRCRQAGQTGQRMRLCVDTPQGQGTVQATARWCLAVEDGSMLVGCEFLERADYITLNKVLESTGETTPMRF
jgi:hypothetical protein